MNKRVIFRHWKPRWAYVPPVYRPLILIGVTLGRLDDFEELPPTYLTLRLRFFLVRSFLLQLRLPAWVDRRRYWEWDRRHS